LLVGIAVAVAVALTMVRPTAPVPDPMCDALDVIQSQQRHAAEFRSWLTVSYVTTLVLVVGLTFSWLYLQVVHGFPTLWVVVTNVVIALITALAAGSWVRSSATNWAVSQLGTCLDETLRSTYAWEVAWLSGWSYVFRLGDWHWAVFLDVVLLALLAMTLGSLAYVGGRRAFSL
jgi:hypothetical protein